MGLELEQDYEYLCEDYWKWWVWAEGSEQELDQIEYVEYTLHPTFPHPVRQIKDRSTKFRLDTAGWGVLYALCERCTQKWRRNTVGAFFGIGLP